MTEQNRDLRSHPSFIIVWTDAAFGERKQNEIPQEHYAYGF
jgi:hypothetical protein